MVILKTGNIFETKCLYIVNPINIVGVMGAGLAKEFKNKHLNYFLRYKRECSLDSVRIGHVKKYYIGHEHDGEYGFILNLPTKKHYKDPSKMSYIKKGLEDFMRNYRNLGVTSVAFSMLGTGNGGLDEKKVLKLMLDTLNDCIVPVEIYIQNEITMKYGARYLKKKKIE